MALDWELQEIWTRTLVPSLTTDAVERRHRGEVHSLRADVNDLFA